MSRDLPVADGLLDLLELEELDTDLYRGVNERSSLDWPALFGGQVAAQALRAAAYTVPEGRAPNSLHGYFLRPGRSDHHVILRVARDRDGRSFSARHVVAIQAGEVIFSMSASFHVPRPGVEYARTATPGAEFETLADSSWTSRFDSTLRLRILPPSVVPDDGEWPVAARMWARTKEDLPDDPLIHACALTFLSDVGSGFGDGTAVGVPRGGPSIDHAMWFHTPVRLDDWVLLDMWPVKAGGSRGLYSGSIQDKEGRLAAMLTQEVLFRDPGSSRRGEPPPGKG